ncbi:MAG: cysteate synthase [Candidatus Helarchaeota archaeon]
MGKYQLYCPYCNNYLEEHYTLDCLNHSVLIRSVYNTKKFTVQKLKGLWKYVEWLPVYRPLNIDSGPITYKSDALVKELRLESLYISFNGYWPEKGANVKSCTFKEYEALATLPRVIQTGNKGLYVASAGNTARSFAYISHLTKIPVVLFVPEQNINHFWVPEDNTGPITLITLQKGNDYTETCRIAARLIGALTNNSGYVPEGGAKNIARRDGMASVLYDAVHIIKKLPHYYFQAIGSGTGGISVWEAALRFREDGRFGNYLPELHLSQNLPYAPIVHAWNLNSREIIPERDMPNAEEQIKQVHATMLTNRSPPYSIPGGVFDALTDTNGQMYGITNDELHQAEKLFLDLEGIDIVPEASVAVASLIKAVEQETINKKGIILLNITGGGIERLKEDVDLPSITPALKVANADVPLDEILDLLQ